VRSAVVAALVLASSPALPLQAQQLSPNDFAYAPGSAFHDAAFGLAHGAGPAASTYSAASGFGAHGYGAHGSGAWGTRFDDYWGSRYFGGSRWGGYRCADVWGILDGPYHGAFEAGFYDDWFYFSNLYHDCVVRGPSWVYHRYHAYRPFSHGYKRFRIFRPRGIYISIAIFDPFWPVWGPFYAYDPWFHHRPKWVVFGGYPVRSVHLRPAPIYRRPSPIYVAGTTFKEDPRAGSQGVPGRSAQPRPSSAPVASAPATGFDGVGIQAPPRRTAAAGGGGVAPTSGTGRTAEPRAGAAGGGRTAPPVAPGPAGNTPRPSDGSPAETTPSRRGAPAVQVPPPEDRPTRPGGGSRAPAAGLETPSAVNRPSTELRGGQPSALPRVITPEDRTRPGGTQGVAPREDAGRALPQVGADEGQPGRSLPQVISPRASQERRTGTSAEGAPERLSGPPPEEREARPSARTAVPRGAPPESERAGDARGVGGRPSDAAQRSRESTPQTRAVPDTRQAPPESRSASPARGANPQSRQGPPARQATPESRGAPESRQAPAGRSAPETRQSAPQTRQAAPQPRAAPQNRQAPPPEARQAPARPSAQPRAQPVPQAPSGGARPLPAPRRPGGE
jgi:hypothetical protein